jgi:hypothetical protein
MLYKYWRENIASNFYMMLLYRKIINITNQSHLVLIYYWCLLNHNFENKNLVSLRITFLIKYLCLNGIWMFCM